MEQNVNLSPEEQKTLEAYKKIHEAWIAKRSTNPNIWLPEFEKFQKLLPKGKIIDIGCGAGLDTHFFIQNGYEYVGIDLSEALLTEAKRRNPRASFQKMNMYALEFPEHVFDGFWAAASLLHIPKQNLSKVLDEIKKITKPSGVGFIAMKEGESEGIEKGKHPDDERFFARYRKEEFQTILEQEGFRVLDILTREYRKPEKTTVWLLYFVKIK